MSDEKPDTTTADNPTETTEDGDKPAEDQEEIQPEEETTPPEEKEKEKEPENEEKPKVKGEGCISPTPSEEELPEEDLEKYITDSLNLLKGEGCMSPTPSEEGLPDGDLEKIIMDSLNFLDMYQKKMDGEKVDAVSLSFLLTKIKADCLEKIAMLSSK